MTTTETTPLLGAPIPAPATQTVAVVQRIHFLDNLRATLTILLIFHHAVIYATRPSLVITYYGKPEILPLALITTMNKSFLWGLFFFVSGYSAHLSLSTKTDPLFFRSRTVKTGLPSLLYLDFGRKGLLRLLDVAGLKDIVGDYRSSTANGDLAGPGGYVFTLLILDYTYLFTRWVGKRWPTFAFTRLETRIKDSRRWFFGILAFSVVLVTLITFGNCFGLRLIPFIVKRHFPLDFPGFGAPITYVIAYIAGVNFTLVQQYILIASPAKAIGALVGSALVPYIALGIAQDRFEPLWKFIEPTTDSEGARWFPDPGFNPPTIFFTLWNPTVIYTFSIALISVFASLRFTTKDWGVWTRHTYLQTYIHMIPIAMTAYFVRNHPSIEHPIVKSVICGIAGVLGSWGVSFIWLTQLSIFKLVYARILRH